MFLLFYEVKKRFFLVSYHVVKADDDMSSVSLLKRDRHALVDLVSCLSRFRQYQHL